jgi:transposase InsO family protein
MPWKKLLANVTGSIDEELRLRNEYLVTENRILRSKIKGQLRLKDEERRQLATIGKQLGRKALAAVATIVKPDTILRWHAKLIARKFDGSRYRRSAGRPPLSTEIEAQILRFAHENKNWGYDRISGALKNLGHRVSDTTIANVLRKHGLPPVNERKKETTWREFVRNHMDVLVATDFFTTEVWSRFRLVTYYVLFFIHLGTRKVHIAGITPNPDQRWMAQIARNITDIDEGMLLQRNCKYLIHDRDSKFCEHFDSLVRSVNIKPVRLPSRSPNLNAYAERFILSVKSECLDRMILFGETALRHVLKEYAAHYHFERNHQGIGNNLIFSQAAPEKSSEQAIECRERLGGLLKFYHRRAA